MKKNETITIEELKEIQLNILDYVVKICEKYEINYWIDCGTLLGAIRHRGYIPWDDDIDIGMLREDYDKFIKIFEDNDQYQLCCYERDNNWFYPFAKIIDKNTILYEPDEKTGIKTCVNIDLFVYDNAPSNKTKLKIMYLKRDFYKKMQSIRINKHFSFGNKKRFNFARVPLHYLAKIFPKRYFLKKTIKNSKKYNNIETNLVGNFTSVRKIVCDKKNFSEFIDVNFEDKIYKAPIGYDNWLKAFYGDYMKLPPEEKRISHHNFVAYKKSEE